MELQGKVQTVGEVESYGNNGFFKRQLIITTEDKYPQTLPIDFLKESSSLIDNIKPGDEVRVKINLRGSESQSGKYYVNIVGWKIEKL